MEKIRRRIDDRFWIEKRVCSECGKEFWIKYEGDEEGDWLDEYLEVCSDGYLCEECFNNL